MYSAWISLCELLAYSPGLQITEKLKIIINIIHILFRYGILPESLKPSKDGTKKTKSTSEEVSVAAAIPAPPESEQEVMEKVKR